MNSQRILRLWKRHFPTLLQDDDGNNIGFRENKDDVGEMGCIESR